MNYYKVISDQTVIGVCSEYEFRRYQAKHNIIIVSDCDRVECVQIGERYYHDEWMAEPGFPCELAAVTEITVEEYDDFKAQLEAGGVPDDGSLDEEQPARQEPAEAGSEEGGEEVKKTAAQILREQIDSVDSQVKLAARFASV